MEFDQDILQSYLLGIATPEETKAVKDWYELSEENRKIFEEQQRLMNAVLLLTPDPDEAQSQAPKSKISRFRRVWVGVAAAVALIISVPAIWYAAQPAEMLTQTITVPDGQRAKVLLPDGSTVWLNSLSSLTYGSDFMKEGRTVRLEGEGYFDVRHDAKKPFMVETRNLTVRDIGTSFNIRDYVDKGEPEVALFQGEVAVAAAESDKETVLRPGEQAVLEKDGSITVGKISNPDLASWIDGIYSFRSKNLGQIAADLEELFDVEINIGDIDSAGRIFSGKFRISEGLNDILDVLSEEYGFKYQTTGDKVLIY